MSDKEYVIPGELQEIMVKALGAESCMKRAVKGYFKYQLRNALFFGKNYRKLSGEFWEGVYNLYPELRGKDMKYDSDTNTLTIEAE